MKITKKLIPIKAHYFCLQGSMSTVMPFLMVFALQLGVPLSISGTLNASSLVLVLILKPAMATLADTFPSFRRTLFLLNLCVAIASMVSIYFVPSMQEIPKLQGQLVKVKINVNSSDPTYLFSGRNLRDRFSNKAAKDDGKCSMVAASDCMATCSECSISTQRFNLVAHTPSDEDMDEKEDEIRKILRMNMTHSPKDEPPAEVILHYWLEGLRSSDEWENISIECPRPEWVGPSCPGVLGRWELWVYAGILVIVNVSMATVLSFTDAIIIDTIGNDGNYGYQRAWGTIGWGLISPISGVLIDLWSGSSLDKNLAPAFIVCFVLGLADVILSMVFLKVPELKSDKSVLKKVLPLLRKPHFLVFCIFAVFNGLFDGFCVYFLLLMQGDMAKGTSAMDNLRFLQGSTLFVQCSLEAPFMFASHWFMRKFGPQRVISVVFLLYIIRFSGLAVTGAWGPAWSTLVVEVLNGPCYGLGFTATVAYSASMSPPGTSTTVQSLINVLYESCGYGLSLFLGGLMSEAMGFPAMFLLLTILSVIVFILHVGSSYLWPAPDAEGKTKHVTGDKDVQDPKMDKDMQTSEKIKSVIKKDDILEETHL